MRGATSNAADSMYRGLGRPRRLRGRQETRDACLVGRRGREGELKHDRCRSRLPTCQKRAIGTIDRHALRKMGTHKTRRTLKVCGRDTGLGARTIHAHATRARPIARRGHALLPVRVAPLVSCRVALFLFGVYGKCGYHIGEAGTALSSARVRHDARGPGRSPGPLR